MKKEFKNNSSQEMFKHTDPQKKMDQSCKESAQHHNKPHHENKMMSKEQCKKDCSMTKPCECKGCCNKKSGMCK